jgi:hypothetical protein
MVEEHRVQQTQTVQAAEVVVVAGLKQAQAI